jgi:DNA-binding transcriptional regulator YdaS (Cro superfamily)
MDKKLAIQLLGGSQTKAARLIGIVPQAISQWPDPLTAILSDRVQAALYRQLPPPDEIKQTEDDAARYRAIVRFTQTIRKLSD